MRDSEQQLRSRRWWQKPWGIEFLCDGKVLADTTDCMWTFWRKSSAQQMANHLTIMHRTGYGHYGPSGHTILYRPVPR